MTIQNITIRASDDDATVDAVSNASYAALVAGTRAPALTYLRVERALAASYTNSISTLRFDTSGIPDNATITSAKLRLFVGTDETSPVNVDSRNLAADYLPGYAGTNADWSISVTGSAFSTPISGITGGAINEFALSNPDTNISKTGTTNFRLMISGGQPTGVNKVMIHSWDHTTDPEPVLQVTFDVPAISYGPPISGASFPLRHAGLGPFQSSGGNYYWFGRDGATNVGNARCWKGSDPISAMTAQTAKLMSSGATTAIEAMDCYQNGNTIYVFTQLATGAVYYNSYTMDTDTWGLGTSAVPVAAAGFAPATGTTQVSAVYRPTAGELVLAYNAGQTAMSSTFNMVRYVRVNVSTGAIIGTATNIDNGGSVNWQFPIAVLGASDRVHFFFQNFTSAGQYQRTLTAANALQTFPAALSASNIAAVMFGPGGSYNSGANVFAPKARTSAEGATVNGNPGVAYLTSADAPTVNLATVSNLSATMKSTNTQYAQAMVADGSTLHSLYSYSSDTDLYHDISTNGGATWGTDVNEWAATINVLTANIYTRSGNKYIAVVVDDNGTIKYAEILIPAVTTPIKSVGMVGIRGAA